jgi:hypothetical protein
MKDKEFLVDGDLFYDFHISGDKYHLDSSKDILFSDFKKVFRLPDNVNKVFNYENLLEIYHKKDDEEFMKTINKSYLRYVLEIFGKQSWSKLDSGAEYEKTDEELFLIDSGQSWSAVFTNQSNDNNLSYESVEEIAKKRNNHYITKDDILNTHSDFIKSVNYEGKNSSLIAGKEYTYKEFFKAFSHPSKYYIYYDPYLFQSGESFIGDDNKFGLNFNNRVLKFLTIFTDNAYNKAPNKKDLPYIFFGGWSFKRKKIKNKIINIEPKELFDIQIEKFKNYILDFSSHKSVDLFKTFIEQNKVHFFDLNLDQSGLNRMDKIENPSEFDLYNHKNRLFLDYGAMNWNERKNIFFPTHKSQPFFKKEKKIIDGVLKEVEKTVVNHCCMKEDKDIISKSFFANNMKISSNEEKLLIKLIKLNLNIDFCKKTGTFLI